jgi:hypothetical protein
LLISINSLPVPVEIANELQYVYVGTSYLLRSKEFSDAASFALEGTGEGDDCNK